MLQLMNCCRKLTPTSVPNSTVKCTINSISFFRVRNRREKKPETALPSRAAKAASQSSNVMWSIFRMAPRFEQTRFAPPSPPRARRSATNLPGAALQCLNSVGSVFSRCRPYQTLVLSPAAVCGPELFPPARSPGYCNITGPNAIPEGHAPR